jgi:hypothetical protein
VELFILNHTVSELLGRKTKCSRVFSHIASMAPQGAYFLIIDRNQHEVRELAEEVTDNAGLQRIWFREERTNLDSDEQAADLGIWYNHMGWQPKLTWNSPFAIEKVLKLNFREVRCGRDGHVFSPRKSSGYPLPV